MLRENFVEIDSVLDGVWLWEVTAHEDNRGTTKEILNLNVLPDELFPCTITQILEAQSQKNTIRGIHFSSPTNPQTKIITCCRGAILDGVVDLRPGSSTFGQTEMFELSEDSGRVLILSPGFGHAYQVLSESATVLYALNTQFKFEEEFSINPLDESLSFPWSAGIPILSDRDRDAQSFSQARSYLESFADNR